jgi:acyl dehydratase
MRLMVNYMGKYALGVEDGRRNGAGVGFAGLKLLQPVRPGHTLTSSHEIIEKPEKVIRGKWGIIRSRNEAINHRGEVVFRVLIDILAQRTPT